MRRWRLNSGYSSLTDQRRTKAGTIPMLKHNMERNLGLFANTVDVWTPQDISTVFWLDASASSTITISTGVSTWADRKGGGVNATQATGSSQPSYSASAFPGSLPGVLFDGVDDTLEIATTAQQNQTHGVYWVMSRSGAGTGVDFYRPAIGCLNAGKTDIGALHYIKNSNNFGACYPYYAAPGTGYYDLSSGTVYSNSTGNIMAFQSNTTGWGVWRNGTIESTTNIISTPNNTNTGYALARQYGSARYSNLVFGEVIMVQTTDTTTRQKIEGYLAWKWGLTSSLPVDHPYKNATPNI